MKSYGIITIERVLVSWSRIVVVLSCVVPNALVTTTKLRKHFFQPFGDLRCKGQHLAIDQYFR